MDSLWSREGCCTGRREVEAQCALRSAVSQVHLEINPLPWCKGSSWKTLAAKHATASILYCFLMLFSSPLIAWGWLLWQLKRCHEQHESGQDQVSAGMGKGERELRKQDGLLCAIKNCPIKQRVIQWNCETWQIELIYFFHKILSYRVIVCSVLPRSEEKGFMVSGGGKI